MSGLRLLGVLVLVQAALFPIALWGFGTEEPGLAALVRLTARVAFALFLVVYLASPLRRLRPRPATRWLVRNRRYLGLAFAWAMALHLLAIGLLAMLLGDAFRAEPLVLVAGGGAYLLTAAMALTSNDRAVRRLGPRRWGMLHRVGLHWLWVVFAFDWTGLAAATSGYWVLAGAAWAAAGIRLTAWLRGRPVEARSAVGSGPSASAEASEVREVG